MEAAVYDRFRGPLVIRTCEDPRSADDGAILQVLATGICRSDWHGWMGHDPGIALPHVPGHEMAGIVADVGRNVRNWRRDDRVTLPFVCGCGRCEQCREGQQQVCPHQTQPGFTHWGSYAEFVAVDHADTNLVRLPGDMDFVTAASLGCRFATAFHAIVDQGRVQAGQWVAVYGCGGVGLSAIMIAAALEARVMAIDVDTARLALGRELGAHAAIDASCDHDVIAATRELSGGGAHVSLDALGSRETFTNSIRCLRRRGRHVQVGLMVDDYRAPPVPMDRVVAEELEILGSHGMQAHAYERMLAMIGEGQLRPQDLIGRRVDLAEAAAGFGSEALLAGRGITVIDRF